MRFARVRGADGVRICAVDERGSYRELRFADTGAVVTELQQVIDAGPAAATRLAVGHAVIGVQLMAPLVPPRNIFCVGRNYSEHAREFAASGFDATQSSGDAEVPEFPVVFTKPAASVIASGQVVDPHADLTSALDYEGEVGVIIGRRTSKVRRADAMDYVWGYTLINDLTARDLQHKHKQWFIGKSLDTFCPMGPWAVTADEVDIRNLQLQSRVNGQLRQDANTSQLVFDVAAIIETMSAGITLEPGDVIATGTPAGVGIGFAPPKYLTTGDQVVISAPGLGELVNTIGIANSQHLTSVRGAELFVERSGQGSPVVLVHGLGGNSTVYDAQAAALERDHTVLRYDLSGHGRSQSCGPPSIRGWVDELAVLLDAEGIEKTAVVAHSMGTLIASTFAATYPERVTKLALLGPVRAPGAQAKDATRARARAVREGGMAAVADALVSVATSLETRTNRPGAAAKVRELLLGQDSKSYASACDALVAAEEPDFARIKAPVLLLTGSDDAVSTLAVNDDIFGLLPDARLQLLEGVGHWPTLEAPDAVTRQLQEFLAWT